jgi:hypothetical protein
MIKGCRVFLYDQSSPTRVFSGRPEHSDYNSKIPAAAEAHADVLPVFSVGNMITTGTLDPA